MFGWDFEVDAWSRFWRWNLIKICVWTCDMISTLRSVVPLAMFCINGRVKSFGFSVSCFIIIINQKSQLSDDHLTLWLINWLRSKLQSSGRRSHSSIRMAMVRILKRNWFIKIPQAHVPCKLYIVQLQFQLFLRQQVPLFNWAQNIYQTSAKVQRIRELSAFAIAKLLPSGCQAVAKLLPSWWLSVLGYC